MPIPNTYFPPQPVDHLPYPRPKASYDQLHLLERSVTELQALARAQQERIGVLEAEMAQYKRALRLLCEEDA